MTCNPVLYGWIFLCLDFTQWMTGTYSVNSSKQRTNRRRGNYWGFRQSQKISATDGTIVMADGCKIRLSDIVDLSIGWFAYLQIFIIFVFFGCNFLFACYIRGTVLLWGIVFIAGQGYFDNRYISANVSKIRQVIKTFCSNRRWNVSGRIVSTHLAGRSLAWLLQVLGGTFETVFGSVRFLFERYQASWISQQKVVESAGLLDYEN